MKTGRFDQTRINSSALLSLFQIHFSLHVFGRGRYTFELEYVRRNRDGKNCHTRKTAFNLQIQNITHKSFNWITIV